LTTTTLIDAKEVVEQMITIRRAWEADGSEPVN